MKRPARRGWAWHRPVWHGVARHGLFTAGCVLRTAARKMARSLAFIRHEELTDEQRRKNADAQAKAAMLAGMIRNPRLPGPK